MKISTKNLNVQLTVSRAFLATGSALQSALHAWQPSERLRSTIKHTQELWSIFCYEQYLGGEVMKQDWLGIFRHVRNA